MDWKHWKPGMKSTSDHRVVRLQGEGRVLLVQDRFPGEVFEQDLRHLPLEPDLNDGPTRGGLLERVRELWDDAEAFVAPPSSRMASEGLWYCIVAAPGWERRFVATDEGDAIMLAIKSAGRRA